MKRKPLFIITVLFSIKLLVVFYLVKLAKCENPTAFLGIANVSGDANSYITPIDNYISEGKYYLEKVEAGRMPYLGLVYYPFRLFFSKPISLSIVVILQVLFASIAVYYIAVLCKHILKSSKAFWLFITLSCFSLYVTCWDYYILSESFGISFICLFAFHYYKYLSFGNRSSKQLLIVGFFLALAILFKPYLCLLFLLIGIEFLIFEYPNKYNAYLKRCIRSFFVICLPLIILDAPWTIRNYIVLHRFIPFQQDIYAGYKFSLGDRSVVNFIETIGESYVFWDKRSAGCYFYPKETLPCEYEFPIRIFSDRLTISKIENAKNVYLKYQKNPSYLLEREVIINFDALTQTYKKEHLLYYYFMTPVQLCKNFLVHSGSYYLPINKQSKCYQPYQFIIKIFQSALYYLCLIFGFIGLLVLLRRIPKSFIFFSIPIYLIIIFPIMLKRTEWRYFHLAYPFLLIGLVYLIYYIKRKLTR